MGYCCNVTLTSVALRKKPKVVKKEDESTGDQESNDKKEEAKDNNGDTSKDEDYDEATCLPKESCLKVSLILCIIIIIHTSVDRKMAKSDQMRTVLYSKTFPR
jgi:hypothetical protein